LVSDLETIEIDGIVLFYKLMIFFRRESHNWWRKRKCSREALFKKLWRI